MAMADIRVPDEGVRQAVELGLQRTGLSLVTADQCDQHGRWRLSAAIGLIADCVPHLHHQDWHAALARSLPQANPRIGGALVEFGFRYRRWPGAGDRVEVRSARTDCTDRVIRTAHWLLDPVSGEAWAVVRTVGVALDLDARRLIALTPEAQAAYRARAIATA